ncbi:hypothetical protein R5W24_000506 [Gemmata sp. JC717]|uniref:hypothetical protein n=1 Tax=Gemmata algarum TaxID=2975278 RepID=UPI0021BAFCA0|nr:hypothetical protein [Gemmata algarum]MDY3551430.1 hypothetical protein [Gemmata algarum]
MTRRPPLVIVKNSPKPPTPWKLPAELPAYTPKEKVSPMVAAQRCLGERLQDRGEMGYYLDGQPANLTRIMRAANRVLKSHGHDQINSHPGWIVD